jgi:hypothetical protein
MLLKIKHEKGVARLSPDSFDIFITTRNTQRCTMSHVPFLILIQPVLELLVNKEEWAFAN